jgi:hypothetical protein
MRNTTRAPVPAMLRRCSVRAITACVLAASLGAASVRPVGAACERIAAHWHVIGAAVDSTDLSGAACARDGACLVVSDDKRDAWWFTIDRSDPENPRLVTGDSVELPEEGGQADAEAAAFDNGWFYAIGSHGTSRRNGAFEPSRDFVYRMRWNHGEAGRWEASHALSEILSTAPGLAGNFCTGASGAPCKSLQQGGVNIEGLAARDGRMYIGFRAPTPGGRALVMQVDAEAVFGSGVIERRIFAPIQLGRDARGRDLGVRDLAAVSDGLLILAGPSLPEGDQETSSGRVLFWSGHGKTSQALCEIAVEATDMKPEVLLELGETEAEYRLLVLFDGVPGGAPVEYRVGKLR